MQVIQEVFNRHAERYWHVIRLAPHLVRHYFHLALEDCPKAGLSRDEAESIVRQWFISVQGISSPQIDVLTPLFAQKLIEHAVSRTGGTGRPKSNYIETRRKIIQGVSAKGFIGQKYCAELTRVGLDTPLEWRRQGCPATYSEGWNHPKWRQRISNEKSKYTRTSRN